MYFKMSSAVVVIGTLRVKWICSNASISIVYGFVCRNKGFKYIEKIISLHLMVKRKDRFVFFITKACLYIFYSLNPTFI